MTDIHQKLKDRSVVQAVLSPMGIIILVGYVIVCSLLFLYLTQTPKYTAEMRLLLPSGSSNTRINIDDVGQVVSQTSTPFNSRDFNPRENYRQILLSQHLLDKVSDVLELDARLLGIPKIKLLQQSSMIEVKMTAESRGFAEHKVNTLYQTFQQELSRLRQDEIERRDGGVNAVLTKYKQTMFDKMLELQSFKADSLLVSTQQIDQLIKLQSTITEKIIFRKADLDSEVAFSKTLSNDLGVTSASASQAFMLQSDVQYNRLTEALSDSRHALNDANAKYGTNHPTVISASDHYQYTYNQLIDYGKSIIGSGLKDSFFTHNLDNSEQRSVLFSDLISSVAKSAAYQEQIQNLIQTEALVNEKLLIYSLQSSRLDRLEKEVDLAEAVYTSAAARLAASKSDVFASYPAVQLFASPYSSPEPSSPNTRFAFVIALIANLFLTSGLVVLCKQKTIINALLK